MARYDKYDGLTGGFRAPLEADFGFLSGANPPQADPAMRGALRAVSLNANGRVVIGTGGGTGLVGVVVFDGPKAAGEIVDVMTNGEIVEFALADGTAASPGTRYGAAADGTYGAGGTDAIGFTVEATRLVVRVHQAPAPAAAV